MKIVVVLDDVQQESDYFLILGQLVSNPHGHLVDSDILHQQRRWVLSILDPGLLRDPASGQVLVGFASNEQDQQGFQDRFDDYGIFKVFFQRGN